MWRYLNTYGINTLPFYTSFCIGSGKTKKRHGATISNKPWFNLCQQQYQPSIPGYHNFRHFFEDAFDGGSCLKVNQIDEPIRLFTSDFTILEEGFIASFAFKRNIQCFDIDLHLVIHKDSTNQICEVICTNIPSATARTGGRKYVEAVNDSLLNEIYQLLKISDQKCISKYSPINDWETRFYYFHLDDIQGKIVDIGINVVSLTNNPVKFNCKYHDILLGAMAFHSGVFSRTNLQGIPTVS